MSSAKFWRSSEAAAASKRKVHLDHHALSKGADDLDRAEPAPGGQGALGKLRKPVEKLQIALEGALDARPQDLDRHRLAGRGDREVHLRDGGRGDRLVGERPEERVERHAELGLHDGPRGLRVEGRQAVLQCR